MFVPVLFEGPAAVRARGASPLELVLTRYTNGALSVIASVGDMT